MGEKKPALLSLSQEKWIDHIFVLLNQGKPKVYFRSDSAIFKNIDQYKIKYIYFKQIGKPQISLKADYIETTIKNPKEYRMPGCEDLPGDFYYGFKNFRMLNMSCEVRDLEYYNTGNKLRNDIQGPCIITDPELE